MVLVFYNINIHIPVELLNIAIQISLSFGQYFNIISKGGGVREIFFVCRGGFKCISTRILCLIIAVCKN